MIVFGSSVTSRELYERCAEPGIRVAAEPDSQVIAPAAAGSIFRSYNLILDRAAALADLEALVLVHQDAEIVDPDFCRKLREALREPEVGVVGCVGAIGVRSIAWWEGSVTWASFVHRYGGPGEEFPSLSWDHAELPPYARTGEVDTVDGFVLGLSPWVVRNVRFDESLGQLLHGYDFDFCLQVREAGRKVVTADFRMVHHHSLDLASDPEGWVEAHIKVAEKWDGRMPHVGVAGGDWKQRARRAEAERAAARAQAISTQLQTDARAKEHQRALDEAKASIGWRITAPLRWAGALRRLARRRRVGREPAGAGH
jgi:Glycosyltransferase like family